MASLALWQSCLGRLSYSAGPLLLAAVRHSRLGIRHHIPAVVVSPLSEFRSFSPTSTILRPFAPTRRFWRLAAARTWASVPCVFPSHPLPGFIGPRFLTTTGSSATRRRVGAALCRHLARPYPLLLAGQRWASTVKSACLSMSASVLTPRAIQPSGFPILRRVARPSSQPRFACATSHAPPSASFRPRCYRRRPCLRVVFPLVR